MIKTSFLSSSIFWCPFICYFLFLVSIVVVLNGKISKLNELRNRRKGQIVEFYLGLCGYRCLDKF